MEKYHREQEERNAKDDAAKVKKQIETEKQIKEIKQWRLEHA